MNLNYFTYKKEQFVCKKCNWQGSGNELAFSDFSEKFSIVDMECPKCFESMGSWLAPTKEEKKTWLKSNPNFDNGY